MVLLPGIKCLQLSLPIHRPGGTKSKESMPEHLFGKLAKKKKKGKGREIPRGLFYFENLKGIG